jgi:hypothetical protein
MLVWKKKDFSAGLLEEIGSKHLLGNKRMVAVEGLEPPARGL